MALNSSRRARKTKLTAGQAVKKLDRQTRLLRKGRARLVEMDLDIVNVVKAVRKINNLTRVMLTQNQQSMLESQKLDLISSDSAAEEDGGWQHGQGKRQRVEFVDGENISLFDANLINGVLNRRQGANQNMTQLFEHDPLAQLIREEFELNSLLRGEEASQDSDPGDLNARQHSQSFALPGGSVRGGGYPDAPASRQSLPPHDALWVPSPHQLSEDEKFKKRLTLQSRGTLAKKEKKMQGQVKNLMKNLAEINKIKEDQTMSEADEDD